MRRLLILCLVAVAGCVGPAGRVSPSDLFTPGESAPPESEPPISRLPWPPEEFWLQVAPGGLPAESYGSLELLTANVDAIVVARASGIRKGRSIPEPNYGSTFATLLLTVDETVRGDLSLVDGSLQVEFFLSDSRLYDRFAAGLPDEEVVLFLRNKAVEAISLGDSPDAPWARREYYRLASPESFFRNTEGLVDVPISVDQEWVGTWDGRPFSDLLDTIRGFPVPKSSTAPSG